MWRERSRELQEVSRVEFGCSGGFQSQLGEVGAAAVTQGGSEQEGPRYARQRLRKEFAIVQRAATAPIQATRLVWTFLNRSMPCLLCIVGLVVGSVGREVLGRRLAMSRGICYCLVPCTVCGGGIAAAQVMTQVSTAHAARH